MTISDDWVDFLGLLLTYVPMVFLRCAGEVRNLVRDRTAAPVKVVAAKAEVRAERQAALEDLAQRLLAPYPYEDVVYGEKMHWGCLLRHMVAAATEAYGQDWPSHVIITCSSELDSLELVSLQHDTQLIACVICDETHWCLLLAHRSMRQAVLYDGLRSESCRNTAAAVVEHLQERTGQKHVLVRGDAPKQTEPWSCGHRVLVIFKWLFVDAPQVWPFAVPESLMTDDAFKALSSLPPQEQKDAYGSSEEDIVLDALGSSSAVVPAAGRGVKRPRTRAASKAKAKPKA